MNSREAQKLFLKHAAALALIEVQLPNGDISIGSAFHIGEGIFVTAKHVIQGNSISLVRITEPISISFDEFYQDMGLTAEQLQRNAEAQKKVFGHLPRFKRYLKPLDIDGAPLFDSNPSVDLAAFRVRNLHPDVPAVELGWHYDDFICRDVWQLNEAIVLGYPPIPFTREPVLFADKAFINAFTSLRDCEFLHFILSCRPRGGFSGGLALHEEGFALGIITRSLIEGMGGAETGYLAVLSIESIRTFLSKHDLLPESQRIPPWSKT